MFNQFVLTGILDKTMNTKIGDVFSADIGNGKKRYFQLIAFDLTQLNSDVIRIFEKIYDSDDNPDLSEIVNGQVDQYVHCVTKFGLKMKLWERVGNILEVGDISKILFRSTNDYGEKVGEEPIRISENWRVWHINDEQFTRVGKLEGENRNAYIGIVINPLGIIEILKGNKYPPKYPDYEIN